MVFMLHVMSVQPHALITGSATRIGREMALFLARCGYNITLHYHTSQDAAQRLRQEISVLGRQCGMVQGDLCDGNAMTEVIQQGFKQTGHITTLIHNASLFKKGALDDVTPDELMAHMQVHLCSPVMLTQAYMQQLPSDANGHIVAISDGMKGWSMSGQFLAYSLSKLALEQYVLLMAQTLAPRVRVNGIAPGASLPGHMDKAQTFEKTAAISPLQCNSSVDEILNALWLLQQSPSMTGQILRLGSGLHL